MNIQKELQSINLNKDNSIVIGSGILNALSIRESNDIDVIISNDLYQQMKAENKFQISENHGKEVLTKDIFEIGTSWYVLGKDWTFEDFIANSIIIDNVRYMPLEFLLEIKKSWMKNDPEPRQKDQDDIELIEKYLTQK